VKFLPRREKTRFGIVTNSTCFFELLGGEGKAGRTKLGWGVEGGARPDQPSAPKSGGRFRQNPSSQVATQIREQFSTQDIEGRCGGGATKKSSGSDSKKSALRGFHVDRNNGEQQKHGREQKSTTVVGMLDKNRKEGGSYQRGKRKSGEKPS